MILRQLNDGPCRTYLVGSERTREVVLVDPLLAGVDAYLRLINEEGLKLRWVIDTHTNSHHLSGGPAIQERAGVHYLMHFNSEAVCVSKRLRERDAIGLGELTLTFLHVPGHTPDSIVIQLPDSILTGDFLLLGQDGAGRLDLPGGDVLAHYRSLAKLGGLPEDLLVHPGHGDPALPGSPLRQERLENPVLSARSFDEYARWWASLRLPAAPWAGAVREANVAGAKDPATPGSPAGADISIAAALRGEPRPKGPSRRGGNVIKSS